MGSRLYLRSLQHVMRTDGRARTTSSSCQIIMVSLWVSGSLALIRWENDDSYMEM
jgi:hypothetical protein